MRYLSLFSGIEAATVAWEAREVVCDEAAIDRILYVTPSDDGQLSLF